MSDSTAMSRTRWERIQALFDAASAMGEHERDGWLAEQCGADNVLHDQVAALLGASASPEAGLEERIDRAIAGELIQIDDAVPGKVVGRYRVLRLVGRGGMGAVYLAERADQQFDQRVALKLIGRALPTGALARRFRAERQILAQLNHPNIARLLDGGTSEDGVPYIAMEYVEGTRIDRYCEEACLDVRRRLRLFQQVCAAIQYAHQNLIVHRDIKPSNILVTADGTPKLLDFGIAKLIDPERTGTQRGLTRMYERVMTPEHASPEQIRGGPIATASDVYSLGVLLYELLAGVKPYVLAGLGLRAVERLVCEVEAPKPSAAAAANETLAMPSRRSLGRILEGDLDNIVLRAMHKEPQRRYASAAALSEDIDRYLDDRPVQARADGWAYRAGKFIRRNKLVAGTAVAVTLLIATVVTFYTIRLAAERDRAAEAAAKSDQVARFLVDVFKPSQPRKAQDREISAIDLLDHGAREIDVRLSDQPLARATLLSVIGLSYKNLSAYDRAAPLLEQSLSIRAEAGLEDTREYAQTLYELANLRRFMGEFALAERDFTAALEIQRRIFGGPHQDTAATLTHLAALYFESGLKSPEQALAIQRQALDMTRAALGEHTAATADRLNNLALQLEALGGYGEAERHLREAIAIQADVLGPRHPDALVTRYNLALLLRATGRYHESASLLRELLPVYRAVFGDGHRSVGLVLNALGGVLTHLRQFDEAQRLLDEARRVLTDKLGADHWRVGVVLRNLGQLCLARGEYAEAEKFLRRALDIDIKTYGAASIAAHKSHTLLASVLARRGECAVAARILQASYDYLSAESGLESPDISPTLEALGRVRIAQNRFEEAVVLLERAVRNRERIGGRNNPDAEDARGALLAAKQKQPGRIRIECRG